MRVSILIDLTGNERGSVIGGVSRIGGGQRRHGPGTMIPWAFAATAAAAKIMNKAKIRVRLVRVGI
jgi:hypothetical protein